MQDQTKKAIAFQNGLTLPFYYTASVAEYQRRGATVYERVLESLYSKRILEALELRGAIRVSPLHCHGTSDIDKFLRITAELARDAAEGKIS